MVRAPPAAAKRRDSSRSRLRRLRLSAGFGRASAGCFVLGRADSFGYRRSLRPRLARLSRAGSAWPSPDGALAERALELVEQALGLAVRAVVGMLVEFAQEAALLVAQVPRHENVGEDPLVATAAALQNRHPAAVQDDDLARLRAGRQFELLLPLQGRDSERCAKRCLREGQVDGRI